MNTSMSTIASILSKKSNVPFPFFMMVAYLLASLNFANLGIYIFALCSMFYIVFEYKCLRVSIGGIILLLFVVAYSFFYYVQNGMSMYILKIFCFFLIWLFSFSVSRGKSLSNLFVLISILAFGMALHGVLNFIYNARAGMVMDVKRSVDYFTREVSSATGQAVNFTFLVGYSFWGIFIQKRVWLKILTLATYLVSLAYDIAIGGRTFLVLSALMIVSGIIFVLFSDRSPKRFQHFLLILLSLVFLILLIVIIYNNNIFGVRNWVNSSYLNRRITQQNALDISNDGRVTKKLAYWQMLFQYPFGGNVISNFEGIGYAHELWLDTFDDAGIVPFVLIIAYTFCALVSVFKVLLCRHIWYGYKVGLICFYIVVYSQFFVEPILQVAPIFFVSFIIVDAAVTRYSLDGPMDIDSDMPTGYTGLRREI